MPPRARHSGPDDEDPDHRAGQLFELEDFAVVAGHHQLAGLPAVDQDAAHVLERQRTVDHLLADRSTATSSTSRIVPVPFRRMAAMVASWNDRPAGIMMLTTKRKPRQSGACLFDIGGMDQTARAAAGQATFSVMCRNIALLRPRRPSRS